MLTKELQPYPEAQDRSRMKTVSRWLQVRLTLCVRYCRFLCSNRAVCVPFAQYRVCRPSCSLPAAQDLVLGSRPEKDTLIAELQEQIRRQLAKVYKGHPDPGPNNMLADLEVYDELGRGGYGTVYRAVRHGGAGRIIRNGCTTAV